MAVRDSSEWRHARVMKKVLNMDRGGTNVMCAWDSCERDGFQNISVRTRNSADGYEIKYMTYVFCTERHKAYWLESIHPGRGNNLPPGWRSSII